MNNPPEEKHTSSNEKIVNTPSGNVSAETQQPEVPIASPTNDNDLLPATLFRMTNGLPRRELNLMVAEATECETQLQNEITFLEKALESGERINEATEDVLQNVLTPLDKYWTASSLLGRLRDNWTLPSIIVAMEASEENENLSILENQLHSTISNSSAEKLIDILASPIFTTEQPNSNTLLGLWKKIYNHKAAFVFKKPVKPEEAPGYIERIMFPMDLSMIRKLIVSRNIKSYSDLHQLIGLIAHNCVKYNGRESEYGRVAREFEAAADELIRQAVEHHGTEKGTTNISSVLKTENSLASNAEQPKEGPLKASSTDSSKAVDEHVAPTSEENLS